MSRSYQVQEFAKLAGVTVRALHHYDRLALLRPRRTVAGYRVYSAHDLERLEHIVALKFLGLPLKQIKSLLDRDARDLASALRLQRSALEEKRRLLTQAIAAIRDAEKSLVSSGKADAAALKKIIEVIQMQDSGDFWSKYYNEAAQAKIAERRTNWSPELQEQATRAWTDLFRDIEGSLGEDPASDKAQALFARWKKLVEGFTGGDADISAGLKRVWADRPNWPAAVQEQTAQFTDERVWNLSQKRRRAGKCEIFGRRHASSGGVGFLQRSPVEPHFIYDHVQKGGVPGEAHPCARAVRCGIQGIMPGCMRASDLDRARR